MLVRDLNWIEEEVDFGIGLQEILVIFFFEFFKVIYIFLREELGLFKIRVQVWGQFQGLISMISYVEGLQFKIKY